MIQLKNITVKFNDKLILNDISFNIFKGDLIHIIGGNGSGKSTLFKCLLGKIKYDGSININRNDVGIVSDYARVPDDILVKDILNFLISINKDIDNHYINKLKNLCGIEEIKNKHVSKLSSGQKRKLEIFSAMIKKKKILIFDELTNTLDDKSKNEVLLFIKNFRNQYKDVIIFYTTHNFTEVIELKGRYMFIDRTSKKFIERDINTIDNLKEEFLNVM